jgi:hypothetical protein
MILNIFCILYITTVIFVFIKNIIAHNEYCKDEEFQRELDKTRALLPAKSGNTIISLLIAVFLVLCSIAWPLVIIWNWNSPDDDNA